MSETYARLVVIAGFSMLAIFSQNVSTMCFRGPTAAGYCHCAWDHHDYLIHRPAR